MLGDGAGSLSALASRQEKLDGMLTELRDLLELKQQADAEGRQSAGGGGLWVKNVTLWLFNIAMENPL